MSKTLLDSNTYYDKWFFSLSTEAKFLFLFLITNSNCNLIGCYEMPIELIIPHFKSNKEKLLGLFEELNDKVRYHNGWVIILNYEKHNPMRNPSIENSKKKQLASIPEEIQDILTGCTQGVGRVYTGYKETETETEQEKEEEITSKKYNNIDCITVEYLEILQNQFKDKNVNAEWEKAKDWLSATGKSYKDYQAFFRNWVRRSFPTSQQTSLSDSLDYKVLKRV